MNVSNPADRALSITPPPPPTLSIPPPPPLLAPPLLTVKLVCVCFSAHFSPPPSISEDSAVSSSCLSLMLGCPRDKVAFPVGAERWSTRNDWAFVFVVVVFSFISSVYFFPSLGISGPARTARGSREVVHTNVHKHLLYHRKEGFFSSTLGTLAQ